MSFLGIFDRVEHVVGGTEISKHSLNGAPLVLVVVVVVVAIHFVLFLLEQT
jgi:hypothetical protein